MNIDWLNFLAFLSLFQCFCFVFFFSTRASTFSILINLNPFTIFVVSLISIKTHAKPNHVICYSFRFRIILAISLICFQIVLRFTFTQAKYNDWRRFIGFLMRFFSRRFSENSNISRLIFTSHYDFWGRISKGSFKREILFMAQRWN